jgi:hypothetical protein
LSGLELKDHLPELAKKGNKEILAHLKDLKSSSPNPLIAHLDASMVPHNDIKPFSQLCSAEFSIVNEERFKQIVKEGVEVAMGDMVVAVNGVVGLHVAPLQKALSKLETQNVGLKNIFEKLQEEILALHSPERLSELGEFWLSKIAGLESLIQSANCDRDEIVKEVIGHSLASQIMELHSKVDPDAMTRELNKVRDELVEAITTHKRSKKGRRGLLALN